MERLEVRGHSLSRDEILLFTAKHIFPRLISKAKTGVQQFHLSEKRKAEIKDIPDNFLSGEGVTAFPNLDAYAH